MVVRRGPQAGQVAPRIQSARPELKARAAAAAAGLRLPQRRPTVVPVGRGVNGTVRTAREAAVVAVAEDSLQQWKERAAQAAIMVAEAAVEAFHSPRLRTGASAVRAFSR